MDSRLWGACAAQVESCVGARRDAPRYSGGAGACGPRKKEGFGGAVGRFAANRTTKTVGLGRRPNEEIFLDGEIHDLQTYLDRKSW